MPVTAADLTYPMGEIRSEWFAGEDLSANLTLWIGEGEAAAPDGSTQAQIDALARAHGYWRAYDAKLMQMAGSPDSASIDHGDLSRTITQGRKYFATKAAEWRSVYDAVLESAGTLVIESTPTPRASQSLPVTVAF